LHLPLKLFLALRRGHQPVLEDEGGDATSRQPAGDLVALVLDGESMEAAARADDDGRAGG
jgi:hypothetical protein